MTFVANETWSWVAAKFWIRQSFGQKESPSLEGLSIKLM